MHEGVRTAENCPDCGSMILYNGNHFCQFFQDGCGWALPHPQVRLLDQRISYRLCGYYEDGNDGTDLGEIVHSYPQ